MRPLRVLHVLDSLVRGGVESWLMHLVRGADRSRIQHDFALHSQAAGAYEEEARALGCRIIRCGSPRPLSRYIPALSAAMRHGGPYDVVHSHVLHFSGVVLSVAKVVGIRGRVAHSHTDTRPIETGAGPLRRGYLTLMSALVRRSATDILACSENAARSLLGDNGLRHPRLTVLPYGIDLVPFERPYDRTEGRRACGMGGDALVIGHIGRMAPEKNHAFILEVAKETLAREPRARFVLIGDGPLKAEIAERARQVGPAGAVVFPEPSTDVARWLAGVFDVFVFPSIFEGIPLALLEAQAAGLPCVVSADAITPAVDVIPALLRRLPLDAGAAAWAQALLDAGRKPRLAPHEAARAVAASPFNIERNRLAVERIYEARRAVDRYVVEAA